jgi:hypothetical protein
VARLPARLHSGSSMPNCDFYAADDDHRLIIEFVLAETSCRVFELSSEANEKLREFRSFAELQSINRKGVWPPLLNLWPVSANPKVKIGKTKFAATGTRRAWTREELQGWGTIQLYLQSPREGGLRPSHTNHNSKRRAERWAPTYPEQPSVEGWDFAAVNRESGLLNRFIRKLAVDKLGSRVVLPGAQTLFEAGTKPRLN